MEVQAEPLALYIAWIHSADYARFQATTRNWSPEIRERTIFISGVLARDAVLDLAETPEVAAEAAQTRREG